MAHMGGLVNRVVPRAVLYSEVLVQELSLGILGSLRFRVLGFRVLGFRILGFQGFRV